jgi:hypothetical protein
MGIAHEVGRDERRFFKLQDALEWAFRGCFECLVDRFPVGALADLSGEAGERNVTRPMAVAAPVEVGIIDRAAARARRMSECGWSRSPWSFVYACTVTM